MHIFKHRKVFTYSLLFLATLFIAYPLAQEEKPPLLFAAAVLFALFLALLLSFRRARRILVSLAVGCAVVFLAILPSYLYDRSDDLLEQLSGQSVTVTAVIHEIHYESEGTYYASGALMSVVTERDDTMVKIVYTGIHAEIGDILTGSATITPIDGNTGSGAYSHSQGYRHTVTFENAKAPASTTSLKILMTRWRGALSSRIRSYVGGEEGELMVALLLGERSGISATVTRDMSRLGISHMLALSGMHLNILLIGMERLLMHLGVDKRFRYLLLLLSVAFYLALTGFCLSAVRAGLMLSFMVLSYFLRTEHDSLTALGAAVAFLCAAQPYSITDTSLWLSAFATLGILMLVEHRKQEDPTKKIPILIRILRYIGISLAITVSASLATLPMIAKMFGTLPLLFLFANLLFAPLMDALLYLSVLVLLFGWASPLSFLAKQIARGVISLSSMLSQIPHTLLPISEPVIFSLCLLAIILLGLYFAFCPPKRFRARAPLAVFLSFSLLIGLVCGTRAVLYHDSLTVYYTATSRENGDVFILRENGSTTVIEMTDQSSGSLSFCFSALADRHFYEADNYVFTSLQSASPAAAKMLFQSNMIHRVYLPIPTSAEEEEIFAALYCYALENKIEPVLYRIGEQILLGQCSFILEERVMKESATKAVRFSLGYGTYRFAYLSEGALTMDNIYTLSHELFGYNAIFFGCYGSAKDVWVDMSLKHFTLSSVYAPSSEAVPFGITEGAAFSHQRRLLLRK